MIKLEQKEGETRKQYLIRLACAYIDDHTGYIGVDDTLFYDDTECDGFCLTNDLRHEFDIDEDLQF